MTATNHILTGALIGTATFNPVVAVILAFLSHFILDSLPHFGSSKTISTKSATFKAVIFGDLLVASAFLLSIIITQPQDWQLLVLCGIAGSSPDIMWLPRWLNDLKDKPNRPMNKLEKFHKNIQWGEKPWGIIIEFTYFVVMYPLFLYQTI